MDHHDVATRLSLHTVETLCDELVSGRGVQVADEASPFRLDSDDTRSIFHWYYRNRDKWADEKTLNRKEDVEAIVNQLGSAAPVLAPAPMTAAANNIHVWHLDAIRAHRFAGIHLFGTVSDAPEDFEHSFKSPLTIIEGKNGAGKTSFLSAITWCLTGHIYRSQRQPESGETPVVMSIAPIDESSEQSLADYEATSVTPLPDGGELRQLGTLTKVPLDTWVELTFRDNDGNTCVVHRQLGRAARSDRVEVTTTGLESLGVPPVALEVGTRMTGLLPYLRIGDKSDLSTAVAELTGLNALKNLVIHARRSRDKLDKDLPKERRREMETESKQFEDERDQLRQLLGEHPGIDPEASIPHPSNGAACDEALARVREYFAERQADALEGAKAVLGDVFDPSDPESRMELEKNVGPALARLHTGNLKTLPSMKRLADLASIDAAELSRAEDLINGIVRQAKDIVEQESDATCAARARLYMKVAGWIREYLPGETEPVVCPVCQTQLTGITDPVTGRMITAHLKECIADPADHLGQKVSEWAEALCRRLLADPSPALVELVRQQVTEDPRDFFNMAWTEELFQAPEFCGSLAPVQEAAKMLCKAHLAVLPDFVEPDPVDFPDRLVTRTGLLGTYLTRLRRTIAFARWRQHHGEACKRAFEAIVGRSEPDAAVSATQDFTSPNVPLYRRLKTLAQLVDNAKPLRDALKCVTKMERHRREIQAKEDRIKKYERASEAIEPLLQLETLVEHQVGHLMQALSSDTYRWRKCLYQAAYSGAPQVVAMEVDATKKLRMEAEMDGTRAGAQHVCNASDLRATLLATIVAFWKELLTKHGGLSLLLFDDLQELFDPENRERVAKAMASLAGEGAQIVLTTNDNRFARLVRHSGIRKISENGVVYLRMFPAKSARKRIALDQLVDEVHRKRKAFEGEENNDDVARDYVSALRPYLENRLADFFDEPDARMPDHPTLADLVAGVRRRVNNGADRFSTHAFRRLVNFPGFAHSSDFLNIMNKAHHGNSHLIAYNDVREVSDDCCRAVDLVDAAFDDYQAWLRRDAPAPISDKPLLACRARDLSFKAPLIPAIAAGNSYAPDWNAEPEPFSCDWLSNHAIYINRTSNLGFACP